MGVKIGGDDKKWQEPSFVSDNAREAIAENWSAGLDESDFIFKKKMARKMYENCARLLHNSLNVTYAL